MTQGLENEKGNWEGNDSEVEGTEKVMSVNASERVFQCGWRDQLCQMIK